MKKDACLCVYYLTLTNEKENHTISTQTVHPNSFQGTILFKDSVVGWLIDGAIEYVTGRPPSEWVAIGLQAIEDGVREILSQRLYSQAMVDGAGIVHPRDCVIYPCPITPNIFEILENNSDIVAIREDV